LGTVVYHWDDLRHSAFDNTPFRLAAIAAPETFYYCIAVDAEHLCVVKGFRADKKYHLFDKPLGYLDRLIADDTLLCADFSTVRIAIRGVPFVVMQYDLPGQQFAESQLSGITDIGPSDTILLDETEVGIQIAFVVPQPFLDEASSWFSGASFQHIMTTLVSWCIEYSSTTTDPVLLVNAGDEIVEIVLCAAGRMYFANHYRITAAEDILYYVLAILEDQETPVDAVQVKCTGPAAEKTWKTLLNYLPRCDVFAFPGARAPIGFPAVESGDLMSVLQCES
jgi:hypothetical protein